MMRIWKNILKIVVPKPPNWKHPSQEILNQISQQMKVILQKAYDNKYLGELYKSVSTKFLLDESVKMYVGSTTCPKNEKVVQKLLQQARIKAKTQDQKQSIEYHEAIFERLDAVKRNDQQKYSSSYDKLLELANKGHPIANYFIGKQIYSGASIQQVTTKQRKQLMKKSAQFLMNSLNGGCLDSFYLMAQMFRNGQITSNDDQAAYQYYVFAASYKNPFAFYQLSQYYKLGKIVEKDNTLFLHYLKKSAQMGLSQAQHDLGVIYLQGQLIKKDEIKALGWFVHAAGSGFVPSKYNVAILFQKGTQCKTLKPNLIYSLQILNDLASQINVSKKIQEIKQRLRAQNKI